MTESVLWYVLAGFLLGFILSTLWEWLYFRRRRMRIENRRIVELEATVRSLSLTSQSTATENSVPSGFAAGYQSPGVFLEGEEDDVDTVEVIVPASPEPLSFDQPADVQPIPESQYGAKQASSSRTPVSNGTGSSRERRPAVPVAAATIAAASVLAEDSNQQPAGTLIQADQPGEVTTNQVQPSQTYVDAALPPQPETVPEAMPAPASVMVENQSSPGEEHQSQSPGLVGDLAATKAESYTGSSPEDDDRQRALTAAVAAAALALASKHESAQPAPIAQPEQSTPPTPASLVAASEPSTATQLAQPSEPAGTAGQGQPSTTSQAVAASEAALQPSTAQPVSPLAIQEPERESSLKPALVAVIASALGSKLADNQDAPPETSGTGIPTTQATSAPPVPEAVANAPEPPTAKVLPGIYDLPEDDQPDTPQNVPQCFVAGTDPDLGPGSASESLPVSSPNPTSDLAQATAPVRVPNTTPAAAQAPALALSAILPQAPKPAPVNKNGAVTRQAGPPAAALAAAGLDPEIEQVSNQLDDLIESLNGLIEKTQPLLQQPVAEGTSGVSPGSSAAAGAPPLAGERDLAAPLSVAELPNEQITGEDMTGQGVTGPYTARNLSRTEYAMVQLMQAARRLGRDLRSAF